MSPEDFRRKWRGELCKFSQSYLAPARLSAAAERFLSEAGLPSSAAPFLSFERLDSNCIPTIADSFGLDDENNDYAVDVQAFWWIGSTGNGDPIALDECGAVWALNHDDGFAPSPLATSVPQLAAILVAYAAYQERLERDRDTKRHDPTNRWLEAEIRRIDPDLDIARFWSDEIENSPEDDANYERVVSEIKNAEDDIDAVLEKLDTLPPDVI